MINKRFSIKVLRVFTMVLVIAVALLSIGIMSAKADGEIFEVSITSDGIAKVRGTAGESDSEVALLMCKSGTDLSNMSELNSGNIIYADQVTAGNNGEYLFKFVIDDKFSGQGYDVYVGSTAQGYTKKKFSGYINNIPSELYKVSSNSVLVGFDVYDVGVSTYTSDNVVNSMIRAMKYDERRVTDKQLLSQRLYYKLGTDNEPLWFDLLDENATSNSYFTHSNSLDDSVISNIYIDRYYTKLLMGDYIDYLLLYQSIDLSELLNQTVVTLQSGKSYVIDNDYLNHDIKIESDGTSTLIFTGSINLRKNQDIEINNCKIIQNSYSANIIYSSESNTTVKITNCKILVNPNIKTGGTLVSGHYPDYPKVTMTDNEICGVFKSVLGGISNGSVISNNIITIPSEEAYEYNTDLINKSGFISIVGLEDSTEDIVITNNTFEGMNRAIGLDRIVTSASRVVIKDNKFINCRYATEISGSAQLNEPFSFTNNYYKYYDEVKAPQIQDSDNVNANTWFNDESLITYSREIWRMTNPYYVDENMTTTASDSEPLN